MVSTKQDRNSERDWDEAQFLVLFIVFGFALFVAARTHTFTSQAGFFLIPCSGSIRQLICREIITYTSRRNVVNDAICIQRYNTYLERIVT